MRARSQGAHLNGYEAFPFFAAAVILAEMRAVPQPAVNALAVAFIVARIGYVVDFLDFSGLHFPWVFNVADSAISVGVALLLLDSVLTPRAREAKRA